MNIMCRMVCCPVGHEDVDTFAGNKASLENKMCFVMKSWKGTRGWCGPGGAGPNNHVWALLQWGIGATGKKTRTALGDGRGCKHRVTKQVQQDVFLAGRQKNGDETEI
jgi:hypothetical protein